MSAEYKSNLLKDKGNNAFRAGDFSAAEAYYSQSIQQNPKNVVLYTNRAQARLHLNRWTDVISDCQAALQKLDQQQQTQARSPSGTAPVVGAAVPPDRKKTQMKSLYLLAQAQVEVNQVYEAYKNALEAYNICVDIARDNPSLKPMSALVIRCKLARWEARERQRLRDQPGLLAELEDLLKCEADSEAEEVDRHFETGAIGEIGAGETKDRIRENLKEKVKALYETFARADPEKMAVREVPHYLIDPITFAIMHDPVITPSGHSYERSSILHHLSRRQVDPMTAQPLTAAALRPNISLREACEEFIQKARLWMYEF